MKNLILMFFLVLSTPVAFGLIPRDLECSKGGLTVIYVPGQENYAQDWMDAEITLKTNFESRLDLLDDYKDKSGNRNVKFTYLENESLGFVGTTAIGDFAKSVALIFQNQFGFSRESSWAAASLYVRGGIYGERIYAAFENRTAIISPQIRQLLNAREGNLKNQLMIIEQSITDNLKAKIKAIVKEQKLILVSHSQGNLFVNTAIMELKNSDPDFEKYSKFTGNVQIASPADHLELSHSVYTTNSRDAILSVPFRMNPNFDLLPPQAQDFRDIREQINNHGLLTTYLVGDAAGPGSNFAQLKEEVLQSIVDIAGFLASNCSKCEDTDGKEYEAKNHKNSNGELGGLVSIDAKVSESAFVAKGAIVCGRAQVKGTSQILGEAFVGGMAVVKDRAKVKDWAKVYNFAIISGDAEISNLAQVYDEAKVTGKAKVGGQATVKVRAIAAENSQIAGKAILTEQAIVYGEALIGGTIRGEASVGGKVKASENVVIGGKSIVLGNVVLFDNAVIGDKAIVKDDAMMLGKSFVYGNAILAGKATIKDDSTVVDNAVVLENGKVQGKGAVLNDSFIAGNAIMTENSFLFERAFIEDDVLMAGWSMAFGDAYILEYSRISGNAFINANFSMFENAHLSGNAYGTDRASAFGSSLVYGDAHIIENAQIFGLAQLFDFALLSGNARAGGFAKIHGNATVTGTAFVDVSGDVCKSTFLNSGYYPYPICNL